LFRFQERLKSVPKFDPPVTLTGVYRDMFIEQEKDRFKLRVKQLVEKEKLVLAVEQVIKYFRGIKKTRNLDPVGNPTNLCFSLFSDFLLFRSGVL
jgi:hypothetical protein